VPGRFRPTTEQAAVPESAEPCPDHGRCRDRAVRRGEPNGPAPRGTRRPRPTGGPGRPARVPHLPDGAARQVRRGDGGV